jgi:LPS biosynthesis protein
MDIPIRDLQLKGLEIFKECKRIFDSYGLRYFALGGTALGAVRHKGFIPWDDDIDIGLPRKDYCRFIEVAKNELKEPYFLQHFSTDAEYPFVYLKVRNSDTTLVETNVSKLKINHGVYIDIFPLDGIRGEHVLNPGLRLVKHELRSRWYAPSRSIKDRAFRLPIEFVSHLFYHRLSIHDLVMRYDSGISRLDYDDSDVIANYTGAWGDREIVERNVMGEGELMQFEDVEIRVPSLYDSYLRSLYGKYMILPAPGKRYSHHNIMVVDLQRTYKEYTLTI